MMAVSADLGEELHDLAMSIGEERKRERGEGCDVGIMP
jgi:hypothetical protein